MEMAVAWPKPGLYVVAVSGGADSMVLMNVLAKAAPSRGYHLLVAHFDHGLRAESSADAEFVRLAASRLGLAFTSHAAALVRASEATARSARHAWLEETRISHGAAAILTAHHQDDLIETSLLNLARGSGRLGLAPMQLHSHLLRPLIGLSRSTLRDYAQANHITWREDPTNADTSNARNLLRHNLLPAAGPAWRAFYLELITELAKLNTKIDQSVSIILSSAATAPETYSFARPWIRTASAAVVSELILAAARRLRPGIALDHRLLTELTEFARTASPRKHRPLRQGLVIVIARDWVKVTTNVPV